MATPNVDMKGYTLLSKDRSVFTSVKFVWISAPSWVQQNLIFGPMHNLHFIGSARESINRINGRDGYDRRWNPELLGKQLTEALFEVDGVTEVVFLDNSVTVEVAFKSDGLAMQRATQAEVELDAVFAVFNERLELITSPI